MMAARGAEVRRPELKVSLNLLITNDALCVLVNLKFWEIGFLFL